MKGKYQSKPSAKNSSVDPKKRKGKSSLVVAVLALVLLSGAGVWLLGDFGDNSPALPTVEPTVGKETEDYVFPTEEIQYTVIDTLYGSLQMNALYKNSIRHEEITEDGLVLEVFYMQMEDGERDLFRICYGNENMGDLIGFVQVDAQQIPVTVVVSSGVGDQLSDEEMKNKYATLMDQLNVLVDSIRADESFVPIGAQAGNETGKKITELSHWNIELPENMTCVENDTDIYYLDFSGKINEQTIQLYTIYFGDEAEIDIIGWYKLGDETVPVGIKTYSLESQNAYFAEHHYAEYAAMMDTINDILPIIMADDNFTREVSE